MSFRDNFGNDNSYSDRMLMLDPATAKSRIFIGNVPPVDCTRQDVEDRFGKYGPIIGVSMNKGFCFVQYEDEQSAAEAIKQEHGSFFRGKRLDVNQARPPDSRGRGPPGRGDKVDSFRERSPLDDRGGPGRDREWRDNRYGDYPPKVQNDRDPYFDKGPNFGKDVGYGKDSGPGYGNDPGFGNDPSYGRDMGYGREPGFGKDPGQYFRGGGGAVGGGRDAPGGYGNDPYSGGPFRPGPKDFPGEQRPPGLPAKDFPPKDYHPPGEQMQADRPNDCEIIVLNKKQREYAEIIERRFKKVGLTVDLLFPNEDIPLGRVLGNIAGRGSLYAVVVMPQNEEHRSLTLNILYGIPQEHRNMPLEDAVTLIGRNFEAFCQSKGKAVARPGLPPGPQPVASPLQASVAPERHPENVQMLLNMLADNRQLTVLQYDRIIRYLQDKREVQFKLEVGDAKGPAEISPVKDPMGNPSTQKQAELQHRILNILNSAGPAGPASAGVPAPTGVPPPANWPPAQGAQGKGNAPSPLLSDPNVQKALDSLIQGDLFRKVSSSSNLPPPAPTASSSLGAPPAQPLFGAYASQNMGRRY